MIRLKVHDYCHTCPAFEPFPIRKTSKGEDGEWRVTDTEIICDRQDVCGLIREYLEKIAREGADNV